MLHLALLGLLIQNLAAQAQPAAIQGIVVKSGTSEALANAVVELRADDDRPAVPLPPGVTILEPAPLVATTTEADGRFMFRNIRPGRYRLVANRPGYVRRQVGITATTGRTENAQLPLTPTGAISGRVYGP